MTWLDSWYRDRVETYNSRAIPTVFKRVIPRYAPPPPVLNPYPISLPQLCLWRVKRSAHTPPPPLSSSPPIHLPTSCSPWVRLKQRSKCKNKVEHALIVSTDSTGGFLIKCIFWISFLTIKDMKWNHHYLHGRVETPRCSIAYCMYCYCETKCLHSYVHLFSLLS